MSDVQPVIRKIFYRDGNYIKNVHDDKPQYFIIAEVERGFLVVYHTYAGYGSGQVEYFGIDRLNESHRGVKSLKKASEAQS